MTIFFNNLKRIFRKKSNFIVMFLVPIAFVVLISNFASSGGGKMAIGISDKDNTKFTKELKDRLSEKCDIKYVDENNIDKAIIDGNISAAVVINSGFTESIINGTTDNKIQTYSIKGVNNDSSFKYYLNSYINAAKNIAKVTNGDKDKFYSGLKEYKKGVFSSEVKYSDGKKDKLSSSSSQIGYLVMSMLFLATVATTLILKDKESGVYNRIFLSGVKPAGYMFQCTASFITIALIQAASILFIMKKFFNNDLGPSPIRIFVVLAVFSIVCVALGTAICNASKDLKQANAVIALVSTPFCMLGGCFWPRDLMDKTLQHIGDFVPTTWAMKAADKVLNGGTLIDASKEIGIMLIFVLLFYVISIVKKVDIAK